MQPQNLITKEVHGMTADEASIMELLSNAHNAYIALPVQHKDDLPDWVKCFHELQRIIAMRVVRRDYPEYWRGEQKKELSADLLTTVLTVYNTYLRERYGYAKELLPDAADIDHLAKSTLFHNMYVKGVNQ